MSELSKFQFKEYYISKSVIELKQKSNFEKVKIKFKVSGIINEKDKLFTLNLSVFITNEEKDLNIQVDTAGIFTFSNVEKKEDISAYFYTNSAAILFPYIRAYISTLTNLSGNKSVTLPTMNFQKLAGELEANTTVEM